MASLRSGRTLGRHKREAEVTGDHIEQKRVRTTVENLQICILETKKELIDLPVELLFDILSRLPLTCLIQAIKYTCKRWRGIINDEFFSEMHLVHSLKNPGHLYRFMNDWNLYFADATSAMQLPGELGQYKYRDIRSCHGLMCYHAVEENSIYICNPIMGDHVKIPTPVFDFRLTWGFGYAPLSKKYKYVLFSGNRQPRTQMTGAIFTLGDKCWRESSVPVNIIRWEEPAAYCDGVWYWALAQSVKEEMLECNVMSFDLETEKTRARHVFPNGSRRDLQDYTTYTTVLGDTVAFVIRGPVVSQEVWTLMDEAQDIWILKFRNHVQRSLLVRPRAEFKILGLWMNRDLYGIELTRYEGEGSDKITATRLLSYDADSNTYSALMIPFAQDGVSLRLVVGHVGCLVSPSMKAGTAPALTGK